MATSTAIQLRGREHNSPDHEPFTTTVHPEAAQEGESTAASHPGFSLPQVDGGKDAWMFLAGCFVIETLIGGFPLAFGLFQDYYRTHEPFAGSGGIPIIGTCCFGIMYLGTPVTLTLLKAYPRACIHMPVIGLVLTCISLVISSFASKTWHLILTQGFLYGVCGQAAYMPCLAYIDQWFVRRKGLAFGIMWSGTGFGGFAVPLLLEVFLNKWGFRTTLRIWAVSLFCVMFPATLVIKPRLPIPATSRRVINLGFFRNKTFLLYQSANITQGIGFFIPSVYLPTFARSTLGASSFASAFTVVLINIASVFGNILIGTLSDRIHPTSCILISTTGAVIGTLLLWGLTVNMAMLYMFCITYGFFAGSYVSSWPAIMSQVSEDLAPRQSQAPGNADERSRASASTQGIVEPILVFGFLNAGRGIGSLASGPVSDALVSDMAWTGQAVGGYGSGYGPLIVFTAATGVIGGISFLWRRIGWL